MNLFDLIDDPAPKKAISQTAIVKDWKPREPPRLASVGVKAAFGDFETDGLRWWAGDKPVGMGVYYPGPDGHWRGDYVAWGHRGGGNTVTEAQAVEWLKTEWRGVHLTNANTRFEGHMAHQMGVDLEKLGVTFSDVQHYAALLDDHRKVMSQESLVRDYLKGTDEEKVKVVNGVKLDPSKMAEYHASIVAVRAIADVRQVKLLKDAMWPLLDAQGLQKVRQLEDEFIPAVVEMERNASPIDVEKLNQWAIEIPRECEQLLYDLKRALGYYIDPGKNEDMIKLFRHEGIPLTEFTEKNNPSFKGDYLKTIKNELVQKARLYKALRSLDSKYIKKYLENLWDGKMYYAIHQLRAQKDEFDDDSKAGTISGRCSSSAFSVPGFPDFGSNIQQVSKPAKQIKRFGHKKYIIRELHIPEKGKKCLSADMMQVEYRIFADKSKNKRILEAYQKDPFLSFHQEMFDIIVKRKPDLIYSDVKNVNFAKIYGAKDAKMAFMMGYITEGELREIKEHQANRDWNFAKNHPKLQAVRELQKLYAELIPEVDYLIAKASHLARPECGEWCKNGKNSKTRFELDELHAKFPHRGYVMTIDGRRGRFPTAWRLHKALNLVIQGSAGDINKRKVIDLRKEADYTGFLLRINNHDEVVGDTEGEEGARRVQQVLNRQSHPQLKIPILWDVNTGANWRECGDD
jgi:DNA polymerase I-like protein with 3'-5' exonuclease and polymerase domains